MAYSALEDFLGDIVGKARKGQGLSENEVAKQTGLITAQIGQIESGVLMPSDEVIVRLCDCLGLAKNSLIDIAHDWLPAHPNEMVENDRLHVERIVIDVGMKVNCYVLVCQKTQMGAVIDPGGQPHLILGVLKQMQVRITHILLTHGHGDHVGGLPDIAKNTGAAVCGSAFDFGLMGDKSKLVTVKVDEGWQTQVGQLPVRAVSLAGHTPGGTGYLSEAAVFSGDALFAGSMGGVRSGAVAYRGQIDAVGSKVLSLPEDTWIFPGHGPITSVGQERSHNPFFIF